MHPRSLAVASLEIRTGAKRVARCVLAKRVTRCVLRACLKSIVCLRVLEFLLKNDSGYPKDAAKTTSWQTLGIPIVITPLGQLHQSPLSPIPGDQARGRLYAAAARHSQSARAQGRAAAEGLTSEDGANRGYDTSLPIVCKTIVSSKFDDTQTSNFRIFPENTLFGNVFGLSWLKREKEEKKRERKKKGERREKGADSPRFEEKNGVGQLNPMLSNPFAFRLSRLNPNIFKLTGNPA